MPLIIATTDEDAQSYARRLLDAAENPAEVQTVTTWPGGGTGKVAFEVSEQLATAAGFSATDDEDQADDEPDQPGTGDTSGQTAEPPARNASRADWVAFLAAQDPPVTHPADAGRDALVALWDEHNHQ